ncbi:arginine decarboxylase, pyruvoyl-dependent [Candidatus Uhrbacteria bacterium]|nr:arginine decarboxylase, pyruvoyl-dependent [Candidatus Uhrbacteria bacterium]
MVPSKVFFTKGVGTNRHYLNSFELALRDAGIEKYNLVTVSSIYPPHIKRVTREDGLKLLHPGSIVFCVMARLATNEPNRLVAASIGAAIPTEPGQYGYLSEHHPYGETEEKAGEMAEDMAATMLATTLGLDQFDSTTAWDEREQQYKSSGKIFKTFNITQSAEGHKEGLWTTVIACAVFIFDTIDIGGRSVVDFSPNAPRPATHGK